MSARRFTVRKWTLRYLRFGQWMEKERRERIVVGHVVVSWVGLDEKLSKRTCQVQRVFGVPGYRLLSSSKKGTLFEGVFEGL